MSTAEPEEEGPPRRGSAVRRIFSRVRPSGASRGERRWRPGALGLGGVVAGVFAVTLIVFQVAFGDFRFGQAESEPVPVEATPPAGSARVLVAGDSIVQGSTGDFTWRYWLWGHLTDRAGLDVEFVGPYEDPFTLGAGFEGDDGYADPDFDRAHAGAWGVTAEQLATEIGELVSEYEPHYLLVMAGVNDLVAGDTPQEAQEHLADLVATARVGRGDVQIVLGELTPVWGTGRDEVFNEAIAEFNARLPGLADQLTGPESPVVVAHTAEGYAPAEDNWDPFHPNTRGELKIAAAFADTLADPLNLGEPYPRPLPEAPVGPRTAPEVEAETDGDEPELVHLRWDPVPGATRYQVWQRRLEPEADELAVVSSDVAGSGAGARSTTVEGLLYGATYAFYVEPFKGDDAGERSQPAEVTIDADPPPAPESLRLSQDGTSLVWTQVPEATHYGVWYRALECGGPPDAECEPVDGGGPDEGLGWEPVAIVSEGWRWELELAGQQGREFAVRAHLDYLEGGYTDPVEVTADE